LGELDNVMAADCARFVYENMAEAVSFPTRDEVLKHALQIRPEGLIAEFGVFEGNSVNLIARLVKSPVYGFDSFVGLHEDWHGYSLLKGAFDRGGVLPQVERNVTLFKGWFHETLPVFLGKNSGPFSFIHIDSDTYEAAKTVLDNVIGRLVEGTIIVFDEYIGYRGWRIGEYKAWQECVAEHRLTYRYLGFSEFATSVVITAKGQAGR
jgi:predicted O-methyltransferase YrrM